MDSTSNGQHYMKRAEVARLFGVHPATVDRWAQAGRFGNAAFKTPGGQWRYVTTRIKVMARQSDSI